MAWVIGQQKVEREKDFNEEILKIEGELNETQAKLTLIKFLWYNLGFTVYLLTGVELLEIQEIIIRAILKRDNSLIVAARGGSKSFVISILSILYPLFFFNSKMCLVSANFRGARRILEYTEKIITSRKAKLLRQCYTKLSGGGIVRRSPDLYKIDLPDPCNSEVFSVPLTEGIRGIRSSFVCIDEMLLVTKELQEVIIRPFLTSKQNLQEELEIRRAEDELIKLGAITENDRKSFPKNKLAGFSSASYQFEYLFEYFNSTIDNIIKPQNREDKNPPTYFCIRYSYEALPENSIIDTTQIKAAAANGGENTDYFKREYKALFSDSSDGYFSAVVMHKCTIKPGDWPTTQILGDKGAEYILAIDPSYASNKNSDFFCQSVYLLNKEERKITLVHTYGRAGADIKEHFEYFVYILTHFNTVFICIDDSGLEFITGFNESSISRDKNLQVGIIKADLDTDDAKEYNDGIIELKKQYNYTAKKFVFSQKFNSANNSIRRMHEHLKNQMEANKVWFASPCCANEVAFNKYKDIVLPFDFRNNKEQILSAGDFIEQQDMWIRETKAHLALVDVKSTSTGVLQYDLPQHLRRLTSVDRPRKDQATCLLMACWIAKIYFDMIFKETKPQQNIFSPIIIR